MSLDYGEKRIGLALTDPLRIFAKPYRVLANDGFEQLLNDLRTIIREQSVQALIIGIPYAIDGGNTPKTDEVIEVYNKLCQALDIPVITCDERYTSDEANKELKKMGYDWKEARKLIDAMAAAMILKNYLETIK